MGGWRKGDEMNDDDVLIWILNLDRRVAGGALRKTRLGRWVGGEEGILRR